MSDDDAADDDDRKFTEMMRQVTEAMTRNNELAEEHVARLHAPPDYRLKSLELSMYSFQAELPTTTDDRIIERASRLWTYLVVNPS